MKNNRINPFGWKGKLKKSVIIMKLTVLLLLAGMLTVSAKNYAQSGMFNFKAENKQVSFVLKKIEQSSDYRFFFVREQVDVKRKVSIDVSDSSIENVLDELFEDQGIKYEIKENNLIVLVPDDKDESTTSEEVQKSVTGTVKGRDGSPMIAVTVVIKGTTKGTVTNFDGEYTLSDVSFDDVLIFSMIGMVTKEIAVENQSVIDVVMEEDVVGLEEVVVIGYGTAKKADLTGAVSTVQSEDLVKIATSSTAQALQGRMTGVQITRTSGEPGSGSTIKIRGVGSLKSDNSPLIMIDGFQGSLNDVNPNDIESVSVLKDASAASIYGARAANGVILVTTKRGAEGKTVIDITAEHGISELTKKPPFMNAEEYATKMNEENIWDGRPPIWVDDYAPENLGEGTDWWDFVYKQGKLDKYHVGIRGGNEKSKYALSLGYMEEEGLIDMTGYNQIQTRFNFDHIFNKWFSVGANYSLSRNKKYDHNENIWGDGIGYNGYGLGVAAHRTSPTVPAYFEDGSKGIYLIEKPGERPGNGTLPPHWYYGNKE
ncbi:MAG: SusC/RagA family TonB-linked outer membrane protein, partial [Draconibacterium sp.]|nr:SusC/RagA family TonB-linked outer membrane protein [Draconibacterium sp.]